MPPVHLLLKPASGGCGMACRYCFYREEVDLRKSGNRGVMSPEIQEKVLTNGLRGAQGECSISYQGGEPLLAGLEYFQRAARLERKLLPPGAVLRHAIQTNGQGLTEQWARFFAREGYLVGLSLDGTEEIHDAFRQTRQGRGTFAKTLEAARLLEEAGVETNILTVVTGVTARRAERVYRFFQRQGLCHLQFIPCLDPLDGEADPDCHLTPEAYGTFLCRLFDLWYRDLAVGTAPSIRLFDDFLQLLLGGGASTCGATGQCMLQMVVEADGSVYPCDFYALDELCLGSLAEQGLPQLRESPQARAFLAGSGTPLSCAGCPWLRLCRGGCRRYRDETGRFRFCVSYQQFFRRTMPRFLHLAEEIKSHGKDLADKHDL